MNGRRIGVALAKRLAVAGVVVALIVATAFAIPAATDSGTEREPLDTPEYDAADLASTPVPAEGEIDADESLANRNGVVVIDTSHSNRFGRADLAPMVEELTSIGYGVRFYEGDQTLDQELSNVNAFVVIDPAEEYEPNEITTIKTFTDEGGHLLLVGEPNRKRISGGFFGVSITDQESALTSLAGSYDMSLGTAYLYNLETNGGNYKHVTARPTPESDLELDGVTMYTAAAVHSRGGTVLLRAPDNTHEAGLDGSARFPVAIHKERDNVVLLGDSSFLRDDRFNVGDNEEFVAFLVEFLVSGERTDEVDDDDDAEPPAPDDDPDPDGDEAETTPVNNTTDPGPGTPAASLDPPAGSVATGTAPAAVGPVSPPTARAAETTRPGTGLAVAA